MVLFLSFISVRADFFLWNNPTQDTTFSPVNLFGPDTIQIICDDQQPLLSLDSVASKEAAASYQMENADTMITGTIFPIDRGTPFFDTFMNIWMNNSSIVFFWRDPCPTCSGGGGLDSNTTIFFYLSQDNRVIQMRYDLSELQIKTEKVLYVNNDIMLSASPNPASASTKLNFNTGKDLNGHLSVYNIKGQLIYSNLVKGRGVITWNTSGLSMGTYFYRLATKNNTIIKKMALVR